MNAARIVISADHIEMVKFANADSDGFRKVSGTLKMMVKDASHKVDEKWQEYVGRSR